MTNPIEATCIHIIVITLTIVVEFFLGTLLYMLVGGFINRKKRS